MSQVIRISDELYNRLGAHASGFDTPSNVIERVLDAFDGANLNALNKGFPAINQEIHPAKTLEVIYYSGSEEDFKEKLLKCKKAYIKLYYTNDIIEVKEWKASKFSASSSVDGNLRSGYLRGWKKRGIYKAELAVNRDELHSTETERF